MGDTGAGGQDRPLDDSRQRLERNYSELLQELRVADTGVQILFAFLLVLAFSSGFEKITGSRLTVYVVTLVCSALAAAFLIAPVSYHRLAFRKGRKPQTVHMAHTFAQCGLFFEMIAIALGIYLVVSVVLGPWWAAILSGATALFYVAVWYVLPAATRPRR